MKLFQSLFCISLILCAPAQFNEFSRRLLHSFLIAAILVYQRLNYIGNLFFILAVLSKVFDF